MTARGAAAPQSPRSAGAAGPPYTRFEALIGTGLDPGLLERALTHRSYAYEHGGLPTNERLEFLGDAVLGLVVTDALYAAHPDLPEGQLAKLRAGVVSTRALAGVARTLGLGSWLRLGKGEEVTGGRDKSSILADTMEAVLGAVYLERGLAGATRLVHRLFDPLMAAAAQDGAALDWKTSLQELAAARALGPLDYVIVGTGPDHSRSYTAEARLAGVVHGAGAGRSKKEAEQQAAELAWRVLTGDPSDTDPSDTGPSDTDPSDTDASDTDPSDTAPSDTAPSDTDRPPTGACPPDAER